MSDLSSFIKNRRKSSRLKILNAYIDNISNVKLLKEIKKGGVLFTTNLDHLMKLQKDLDFFIAYDQADYIVCDSQILFWASRFLGQKIPEKISGSDFFPKFYRHYQNDSEIKIFLLGGIEGVAEQARQKINSKVARPMVIGSYSPSIGFEDDEEECQKIVAQINNSNATVLAIGVGAPKQEKWINKYKNKLTKVKIFLAIGATIDFEAGTAQRAPKWMSNAGLEWLHRLVSNPKRLWKRYLLESLPFFWLILLQKLNLYKYQPENLLAEQDFKFTYSTSKAQAQKNKPNVLMFGPCLSEEGGMATVQGHIINNMPKELNIEHITTWNGKSSTLTLFSQALITFLACLRDNKVDLVHIHVSERGSVLRKSIIALIAFAFSKPVIMHTHGCEFHLFYESLPKVINRLLSKIWQNCACVIALSNSWKQTYVSKLDLEPDQVLVGYNPVVVPRNITPKEKSDKTTILFLGKINQRKGVFDLLAAVAQLYANYPQKIYPEKFELIIAGNGEINKAIALAKELEIDSIVTFPGWINIEQRDRLLEAADIFVLPSYNEGLPMALLEAMSWKLPVITTPVGGIPEIIIHEQTGLLIEPGNIQQMLVSIQTLIHDQSLREKLGNAAYKQALLLDIEHYSHDILDIYRSILDKNKQ